MGLFDATREWLARKVAPKQAISNPIQAAIPWGVGYPHGTEWDVRMFADEGYRRNAVIYACISAIATSVAEPDIVVRKVDDKEEVIEDHPLVTLLQRPHPEYDKFTLFETLLIHLQTAGMCFIHKGRNGGGQVMRLTPLRPDRMFPIPGETGDVEAYEYRKEGQVQVMPREDVICVKFPDPLDDYNGLSPIAVCAKFGDIDNEAALFIRDFFMNGGVPAGLLKLVSPVRPEERLRIQQQWAETYGRAGGTRDASKWHSIGVINAGVEYQEVGVGPGNKLNMDTIWGVTETRICTAFGVPPVVIQVKIGLQLGSKYSSYEEACKSFWRQTLMPMYARFDEALTYDLAAEFDDTLEVVFDLSHVPALQESQDALVDRANKAFTAGIMSRDEVRKEFLLLEPLKSPDGKDVPDVIVVPATAVPLEKAGERLLAEPAPGALGGPPPALPGQEVDEDGKPVPGKPGVPGKSPFPPKKIAAAGAQKQLPPGFPPKKEAAAVVVPFERSMETLASPVMAVVAKSKPKLSKAVVGAVQSIRNRVDMDALASAIEKKDAAAAEKAIPWDTWPKLYGGILTDHAKRTAVSIGRATYGSRFREDDPAIAKAIEGHVESEVERTTEDGWASIRAAIDSMIETESNPHAAARIVRAVVGLNKIQTASVIKRA